MTEGTPARAVPARRLWILVLALAAVIVLVVVLVNRSSGAAGTAPSSPSSSTAPQGLTSGAPSASPATSSPPAASSPSPSASAPAHSASAAPGGRPTAPPVAITATAAPVKGVTAHLARIESVTGRAELPGEVGGPALRLTIQVDNDTRKAVDLSGLVVNLYLGRDAAPAVELSTGARAMPASVAPGKSATGVWVFNVPADERELVAVEVDLATDAPVVVFRGEAPPAG
jgi:hypothetical protein